eukprot:TRINITY_DN16565_c0_g1_i1.p1 TRINITY_DN16565_c0_g1~~TRINITY_DN16565_c0_g1_i1.p1  ORF type:complete len:121 (-),score=52.36 TRINITY_DN16565_c0_g1_i1:73-435(-)
MCIRDRFCGVNEPDFTDGVEELIQCTLQERSVLLRVHLGGQAKGEAPLLVSADPSSTIGEFKAMVQERVSDELQVGLVTVENLRSMQGEPVRRPESETVRDLVAEAVSYTHLTLPTIYSV